MEGKGAPPPPQKSPAPAAADAAGGGKSVSVVSVKSGNNNQGQPTKDKQQRSRSKSKNSTSPAPPPRQSPSPPPPPEGSPKLTPHERSKLAREKFQSLLLTASKITLTQTTSPSNQQHYQTPGLIPSPNPNSGSGGLLAGLGLGIESPSAARSSRIAQSLGLGIGTKPSGTLGSAAKLHIAAIIQQMNANIQNAVSTPPPPNATGTQTPPPPKDVEPVASSSIRASTIAALAKVNAVKNTANAYPNIDPRVTFPKTLSPSIQVQVQRPVNNTLVRPSNASKSMAGVNYERGRNLRAFVEKAIQEHKVFTCVGVYPAIKNALKKRGWVEKTQNVAAAKSAIVGAYGHHRGGYEKSFDEESDAQWIARNLRDYAPDFIWLIRRDNVDWKGLSKDQLINRFPKAWFTTKVGLTACLQQIHWFSEAGFSETFYPRCYRLCLEDEKAAFQEDFRLTASMSFLRYFVETYEAKGPSALVDPTSRITPLSIDFAARQLGNYIRMRRHEDIDWLLPPNFMSQHWDAFITQYYMVVQERRKIRFETVDGVRMKYDLAKKTLGRIVQYWPQAHLDGVYNMWICKPGARSRGKGIVIMNTLEKILDLLNHGNSREANWVVQKYMERPLLVYKTKFDMRQWFIITDWSPLTVWFYKESYIRFCTKPFVLEDFHESIHLCNNAIQCRYTNAESRDRALPDENMWDCYTFQAHLKSVGKLDMWPKIYGGMKQAIIGVLLASQEGVEAKRGCFELYGADFMLDEGCVPWLIEINSCPCMAATTSITARMCAQCLEDTIKVVVDRRMNKNADTGMFEMVYRQPLSAVTVSQFTGHDLAVHGKKLTRDVDWPHSTKSHQVRRSSIAPSPLVPPPSVTIPPPENLTFSDLLQKLRMKNTQMFQRPSSINNINNTTTNTQVNTTGTLVAGPGGITTTLGAADIIPDRSLTGTLLSKMRALQKLQNAGGSPSRLTNSSNNNNEVIPGMKRVYPIVKSMAAIKSPQQMAKEAHIAATNGLGVLSKYFDEGSATYAHLLRIGRDIPVPGSSTTNNKDKDAVVDNSQEKGLGLGRKSGLSPFLTAYKSSEGKTLEQVRASINSGQFSAMTRRGETTAAAPPSMKSIMQRRSQSPSPPPPGATTTTRSRTNRQI